LANQELLDKALGGIHGSLGCESSANNVVQASGHSWKRHDDSRHGNVYRGWEDIEKDQAQDTAKTTATIGCKSCSIKGTIKCQRNCYEANY